MKRFLVSLLTVVITIILFAGAAAGYFLYQKYGPSKEMTDRQAWFGVSGDEVAIILNNELQSEQAHGRYIDGQVYLPIDWVNEHVNERFYWDSLNHQLIYTLPESIVYAGTDTVGSSGTPLFIEQDDQVWLLIGLILNYSDVRMESFTGDDVKRVFVDTNWDTVSVAEVKKDTVIRIRGGGKSSILAEAASGESVIILEELENWTKVRTADGYVGYLWNRRLKEAQEQPVISTFSQPVYTSISLGEPVCLVWHQVTSMEANDTMKRLIDRTDGVNVIAPTWFMLTDNEGNFDSLAKQDYVDQAHAMGLQVWAVLDNFNRGENVQSEVLFADTNVRKKLIAGLMKEIEKYGIDGINLDIEGIKSSAGPHYLQFIRELSVDCRKNGIILSIDSYVPTAYNSFYNWAEQGRVADYVVIMGYDEHYAGGEAGSVASLGYERKGIEDTLRMVPKEKVVSGIPFYTRVWNVADGKTTSTAMGIEAAKKWVEDHGMELYWQEELGQYYGELEADGGMYYLWMEEERSIGAKVALIDAYDIAGAAFWKLGFEPESIWEIVNPRSE
ncbi:MAG: glycosyl hydrolase family 18 protein [Brotaphodocola sp.]